MIVMKYFLPPISPGSDMINSARIFDA